MEKSQNYFCNVVAKNKNIVERLFEAFKERKVSVPEFERQTGINRDRVYKWKQEGTFPKADDQEIIENWLCMEKSPRETINPTIKPVNPTPEAIISLSEANKKLSDANTIIAESNRILAKNNQDLISLLNPIGDVEREIHSKVHPLLVGLQDFLVEVAAGRKYESTQEAAEALHNKLSSKVEAKKVKNRNVSDDKNRK